MPGNQQMPDLATSGANTGNDTCGNPADCFKCKNPLEDDWVKNTKCDESDEAGGCYDRCAEAQATHNAKCNKVRRKVEAKLDSIGCPSNLTEKYVPVNCPPGPPGGNRGNYPQRGGYRGGYDCGGGRGPPGVMVAGDGDGVRCAISMKVGKSERRKTGNFGRFNLV